MTKDVRSRAHVVLCHPADVRNVGTAIRAVANHGLASIRIVTQTPFDTEDMRCFSSGALPRVDVQVFENLEDAIGTCGRVLGTSRRGRDELAPPEWPASGLSRRLELDTDIALLFGTERTGLTREEVDRCEALIYIPTCEAHPSLNLGHAVACIGYELARPDPATVGPPVVIDEPLKTSAKAREAFYDHVRGIATELNYPPGRTAELFTRRLRRILMRSNPTHEELGLFAGVFSEMRRLANR